MNGAPDESRVSDGLLLVLALVAAMWALEAVDALADHRLDGYGIEPREGDGLIGIVAAPFLHDGFAHLAANTVPFAVMGFVIALKGALRLVAVGAIVMLVGGLGTWLVAPSGTNHIGASGVVFGFATYLLSRGVFSRNVLEIAIGVAVGVVWGGALLGGLVPQEGISWQGHLFGALGGVAAARLLSPQRERELSAGA
jgi:membrane associated rhomboid family serine protease